MTYAELHEILDDENRKLTTDELKEIVYQLKEDVFEMYCKELSLDNISLSQFYIGENTAFQICLDLLEHLKEVKDER